MLLGISLRGRLWNWELMCRRWVRELRACRLRSCVVLWAVVARSVLRSMPVFGNREVEGCMCLHYALCSKRLSYCTKDVVLNMAWLHVVGVPCYEGHVLALFVLETDFPAIEKFRPRLDIS
jgi:hypothetical protein